MKWFKPRREGAYIIKSLDGDTSSRWRKKKQPQVPEAPPPQIQVLDLQPGDSVLVLTEYRLSPSERDKIRREIRELFDAKKIAILDHNLTLKIIKNTEGANSND